MLHFANLFGILFFIKESGNHQLIQIEREAQDSDSSPR